MIWVPPCLLLNETACIWDFLMMIAIRRVVEQKGFWCAELSGAKSNLKGTSPLLSRVRRNYGGSPLSFILKLCFLATISSWKRENTILEKHDFLAPLPRRLIEELFAALPSLNTSFLSNLRFCKSVVGRRGGGGKWDLHGSSAKTIWKRRRKTAKGPFLPPPPPASAPDKGSWFIGAGESILTTPSCGDRKVRVGVEKSVDVGPPPRLF